MLKLKMAQFFSKVAQNVAKSVFISKGTFFKIAQKPLGLLLKQNISPRTLENRPIWSHSHHLTVENVGSVKTNVLQAVISQSKLQSTKQENILKAVLNTTF